MNNKLSEILQKRSDYAKEHGRAPRYIFVGYDLWLEMLESLKPEDAAMCLEKDMGYAFGMTWQVDDTLPADSFKYAHELLT